MPATATVDHAAPEDVRAFLQEYLEAWKSTDENKILAFFSDDIVLDPPTGTLDGKLAVRDHYVRTFIAAFPGNVNTIRHLTHGHNVVALEWTFEAVHTGKFAGVEATGKQVRLLGCSLYEYDLGIKKILAGRIYFDVGTLLRQIGA